MAKARKKKRIGAVADAVNGCGRMVRKFAPGLLLARATLYPFEDLICAETAGPQPQANDYDPDGEPYFEIEVNNPSFAESVVHFRVNAYGVVGQVQYRGAKGEDFYDDPFEITLDGMHDYLRQLPRPPASFVGRG